MNKAHSDTTNSQVGKGEHKQTLLQSKFQLIMEFLDSTQMFFLLLSIPFLIVAPYCMKNIYEIVEETRYNKPDYEGPKWADFLWLFATLPAVTLGKCITVWLFKDYYLRNIKPKYQGEIRELKANKGCDNIFKSFYFTAISIYGYYAVVLELPFESPVFGNGTWENYFIDFPYVPFLRATTYYCIFNLSYHLESCIHIVIKPGNDFFEMLCHHIMSCFTISIAYITNYNNIAIPFMLIIDNADIFIGLIRIVMDICSDWVIMCVWLLIVVDWAYTRIYLFFVEILYKASIGTFEYATGRLTPHYYMSFMLSVLLILNLYWFTLLIKMGFRFATSQGVVDAQKDDSKYLKSFNKENKLAPGSLEKKND